MPLAGMRYVRDTPMTNLFARLIGYGLISAPVLGLCAARWAWARSRPTAEERRARVPAPLAAGAGWLAGGLVGSLPCLLVPGSATVVTYGAVTGSLVGLLLGWLAGGLYPGWAARRSRPPEQDDFREPDPPA
jgi:hypothetical protein